MSSRREAITLLCTVLGAAHAACDASPSSYPPSQCAPGDHPNAANAANAANAQDPAMIHLVRDLAQFVTHRGRTVDELTTRLGKVEPSEDNTAVHVHPSDALLQGVRIERYPDGTPFTIGLRFVRPIPIAELKVAFGAYKTLMPSDPFMPWPLIFPNGAQGSFGSVALLVDVAGRLAQLDHGDVATVTLRIDPIDPPGAP